MELSNNSVNSVFQMNLVYTKSSFSKFYKQSIVSDVRWDIFCISFLAVVLRKKWSLRKRLGLSGHGQGQAHAQPPRRAPSAGAMQPVTGCPSASGRCSDWACQTTAKASPVRSLPTWPPPQEPCSRCWDATALVGGGRIGSAMG